MTIKPVRWLWQDRIPAGALTLVPGREGIGKSLYLVWLTAQITRGTLHGLHYGTPKAVIYAATEDSWSYTIAPRLVAAGADLDLVYRVDVETGGGLDFLTLPKDTGQLAQAVTELGVGLLAADPLLSLIASGIDTHRDRDLRSALEPLAKLADKTGCAVVGLAHFNKSTTTDSLTLITGSRAFSAVARAVMAVARDTEAEDGSCIMSQVKSNLGPLNLPSLRYIVEQAAVATSDGSMTTIGKLVFTGETDRSVNDILGEANSEPGVRKSTTLAKEWLVSYLMSQGGEAARGDLLAAAKREGIAERTLQRVYIPARVEIVTEGFPRTTIWRLITSNPESPETGAEPSRATVPPTQNLGATGATGATEDLWYTDSNHSFDLQEAEAPAQLWTEATR